MKLAVAEAIQPACDLVYYEVCIRTRATVASRDREDSKDTQLARIRSTSGTIPKTALRTHTLTHTDPRQHTNTAHTRMHDSRYMARHGRNTQELLRCSRTSAGELWKTMSKLSGRARA